MNEHGIQDGDEVTIIVKRNRKSVGEVTVLTINANEVSASVYLERPEDIFTLYEALQAGAEASKHHLHRPLLRRMLRRRIDELKEEDRKRSEDYSPSPADDNPG